MIHKTIIAVFSILFTYAGVSEALSDEFEPGHPVLVSYYCDDIASIEAMIPGLGQDIPEDIGCYYMSTPALARVISLVKKTSTHEIYSIKTPYGVKYSAAQIKGQDA
jgi:hypothetical protein